MAQSEALAAEGQAMRSLEAAIQKALALPSPRAQRRALDWGQEQITIALGSLTPVEVPPLGTSPLHISGGGAGTRAIPVTAGNTSGHAGETP